MPDHADKEFLVQEEYGNVAHLESRLEIQERYRTHPRDWFLWLFDHFDLAPGSRLLELGCGPGTLWEKNLDRLQEGWELLLTDLSPVMVREAKVRLGTLPAFDFAIVDAEALPFPDSSFDAVIAIGLLDHLPHIGRACGEIHRVLKGRGTLFISAGGRSHLKEIERMVQPFLPGLDYGGDESRFGLENGVEKLAPTFPDIIRYDYRDTLHFSEPGPILEYVLSEGDAERRLRGERREGFESFLREELGRAGEIRCTIDKGLFVARPGVGGRGRP